LVLLLLGGGLSLGAAELMLGLAGKSQKSSPGYISQGGFYTYPPGSKFHFPNEDGKEIRVETDEYGLRNRPGTLAQAEAIILGDSFISAINTLQEQTLTGRLFQYSVKAYNAGMSGYSTYNEIYLLRYLVERAQPKIIILCFYLGNDFRENYFERHNFPSSEASNSPSQVNPSYNLLTQVSHPWMGEKWLKLLVKTSR